MKSHVSMVQVLVIALSVLRSAGLRQLDQRVSIRYQLKPLSEPEVSGYISHRLAIASSARNVVLTPTALQVVSDYPAGIPHPGNHSRSAITCKRIGV